MIGAPAHPFVHPGMLSIYFCLNVQMMGCFCGFLPLITGLISSEAETQQERLSFIIPTVFSTNLLLLYFPAHNDPRDRLFNLLKRKSDHVDDASRLTSSLSPSVVCDWERQGEIS